MNLFSKKQVTQPDSGSQQSVDSSFLKTSKKVQKKPKKQIKRLCQVCMAWFTASRADAKYCTQSCRQKAYSKGKYSGFFDNPGEYLFFEAVKMVISSILDNHGKCINKSSFNDWMLLDSFINSLFFNYLPEDSQFATDHKQYMMIFYKEVSLEFKQTGRDEIILDIPHVCYSAWSGICT